MNVCKVDLLRLRPKLDEIDLLSLCVSDSRNIGSVRGSLAEALTKEWLVRTGFSFDSELPRTVKELRCVSYGLGARIFSHSNAICEFDLLAMRDDHSFIVEVKSMGLNGFAQKIPRYIDVGRTLYGSTTQLLLFFPQYYLKANDAVMLEKAFPGSVQCFDLGYTRRQLDFKVQEYLKLVHG